MTQPPSTRRPSLPAAATVDLLHDRWIGRVAFAKAPCGDRMPARVHSRSAAMVDRVKVLLEKRLRGTALSRQQSSLYPLVERQLQGTGLTGSMVGRRNGEWPAWEGSPGGFARYLAFSCVFNH